jgi:hypothetical protein
VTDHSVSEKLLKVISAEISVRKKDVSAKSNTLVSVSYTYNPELTNTLYTKLSIQLVLFKILHNHISFLKFCQNLIG